MGGSQGKFGVEEILTVHGFRVNELAIFFIFQNAETANHPTFEP